MNDSCFNIMDKYLAPSYIQVVSGYYPIVSTRDVKDDILVLGLWRLDLGMN